MDSKSPKSHWSARNNGLMSPCRVSVALSCMFPASVLMMRSFSFRMVSLSDSLFTAFPSQFLILPGSLQLAFPRYQRPASASSCGTLRAERAGATARPRPPRRRVRAQQRNMGRPGSARTGFGASGLLARTTSANTRGSCVTVLCQLAVCLKHRPSDAGLADYVGHLHQTARAPATSVVCRHPRRPPWTLAPDPRRLAQGCVRRPFRSPQTDPEGSGSRRARVRDGECRAPSVRSRPK